MDDTYKNDTPEHILSHDQNNVGYWLSSKANWLEGGIYLSRTGDYSGWLGLDITLKQRPAHSK